MAQRGGMVPDIAKGGPGTPALAHDQREADWNGWLNRVQAEIPPFCRQNFWGRGVWSVNRHALGWDLVRAPCNLFLAPVWVLLQALAYVLQRCGARRLSQGLRRCPPGLQTRSQVALNQQLEYLLRAAPSPFNAAQECVWATGLLRYQAARQATSEILANILVVAAGLIFYQQLTPGGLGLGTQVAQHWHLAEQTQQFWAGASLGGLWYGAFPPHTPTWITVAGALAALCLIALVSAMAGFITDPIQYRLGWHQRRLRRMVAAIHRGCVRTADNQYLPSEPWLARLFDALDWLRLGG